MEKFVERAVQRREAQAYTPVRLTPKQYKIMLPCRVDTMYHVHPT